MHNRSFTREDFSLVRLKGEEDFIIVGANDTARTAIKILKQNGRWGKVLDEVNKYLTLQENEKMGEWIEAKKLVDEDLKKVKCPSEVPYSVNYYLSIFAQKMNNQFDFYFIW